MDDSLLVIIRLVANNEVTGDGALDDGLIAVFVLLLMTVLVIGGCCLDAFSFCLI